MQPSTTWPINKAQSLGEGSRTTRARIRSRTGYISDDFHQCWIPSAGLALSGEGSSRFCNKATESPKVTRFTFEPESRKAPETGSQWVGEGCRPLHQSTRSFSHEQFQEGVQRLTLICKRRHTMRVQVEPRPLLSKLRALSEGLVGSEGLEPPTSCL